jgi:hypothetical protein
MTDLSSIDVDTLLVYPIPNIALWVVTVGTIQVVLVTGENSTYQVSSWTVVPRPTRDWYARASTPSASKASIIALATRVLVPR